VLVRFLATAGLGLVGFCSPADACSPVPFDHSGTDDSSVDNRTVEEIISQLPEAVLEGEIIQRDPLTDTPSGTQRAKLRVFYAWKGEAESVATLEFIDASAACMWPPPDVGTHVIVEATPRAPNVFFYDGDLQWLRHEKMDQALHDYKRRTDAMKARADAGGYAEQMAFAAYLQHNGEVHRALWMYESFLRQDPDDFESLFALSNLHFETHRETEGMAALGHLRELAERSEEWRGKVARFEFEATGWLTAKWKDWSSANSTKPCRVLGTDFDEANFEGAVLDGCSFLPQATFRGANFRGADLAGVSFALGTDFRDAEYDCATQFRKDVDPVAEGMINVEGGCPKP
jgi:hypothetical protein